MSSQKGIHYCTIESHVINGEILRSFNLECLKIFALPFMKSEILKSPMCQNTTILIHYQL